MEDFIIPSNLKYLLIRPEVKLINPKSNSVLTKRLNVKVEITEFNNLNHDELIFLYLNFVAEYELYELLITKLLT
jgi:hypothetical protein